MLTQQQIGLIRENFDTVAGIAPQAAEMFYQRLFELNPSVRPLFKGDMVEQGRKLLALIGTVVRKLDQLDDLVPSVQGLAKRHLDYGVQPAHYDTVGEALIWTLEQGLAEKFTSTHREAWCACYALLAQTMKDAAYKPKAA